MKRIPIEPQELANRHTDKEANEMHENVVDEIVKQLSEGRISNNA
jgi:hypothetical protein